MTTTDTTPEARLRSLLADSPNAAIAVRVAATALGTTPTNVRVLAASMTPPLYVWMDAAGEVMVSRLQRGATPATQQVVAEAAILAQGLPSRRTRPASDISEAIMVPLTINARPTTVRFLPVHAHLPEQYVELCALFDAAAKLSYTDLPRRATVMDVAISRARSALIYWNKTHTDKLGDRRIYLTARAGLPGMAFHIHIDPL